MKDVLKIENPSCERVLRILNTDYYSIREASRKYDPSLEGKATNHRTVTEVFNALDRKNLLDTRLKKRTVPRKRKGKIERYTSTKDRSRLKPEFYFYLRKFNDCNKFRKEVKQFIISLFNEPAVRKFINEKKDVRLDQAYDQLLLIYKLGVTDYSPIFNAYSIKALDSTPIKIDKKTGKIKTSFTTSKIVFTEKHFKNKQRDSDVVQLVKSKPEPYDKKEHSLQEIVSLYVSAAKKFTSRSEFFEILQELSPILNTIDTFFANNVQTD